ncbi:MAG: TRAP transporter small permease [Candidatus Rokuibacteriota bacterium]
MLVTLDRWIYRGTAVAVMALMAAMTAAIGLQVFCRYVLNASLVWPEEFSRYAMVWVTCLAAGIAVRQAAHVGVDTVIRRLPDRLRRAVVLAGHLLTLVFLGVMLFFGVVMVGRVTGQTSAALEISMTLPYAALPVGAALMLYEYLRLIVGWGVEAAAEDIGR